MSEDAAHEAVGSLGEEAAKLIEALAGWAKDQGTDAAGQAAAGIAGAMQDASQHAGGGADCRYCPICQVIHVVKTASPEVRGHLATAALSLAQAFAAVMATTPERATSSVEHIDLESEDWDDSQPTAGGPS